MSEEKNKSQKEWYRKNKDKAAEYQRQYRMDKKMNPHYHTQMLEREKVQEGYSHSGIMGLPAPKLAKVINDILSGKTIMAKV